MEFDGALDDVQNCFVESVDIKKDVASVMDGENHVISHCLMFFCWGSRVQEKSLFGKVSLSRFVDTSCIYDTCDGILSRDDFCRDTTNHCTL